MSNLTARLLSALPFILAATILARITAIARAQDCLWPTWTQVASNPELARFEHAMAYDAARNSVVMFGGRATENTAPGDTAIWNGKSWQPLAVPGPSPRAGHAMAYDPVRQRIVLSGGTTAGGAPLTDTWQWDGHVWTLASATAPASVGPVMAWDSAASRLLLANSAGQLWSWDGSAWTLLETGGPAANAVAFDESRGVLVATELWNDTFEWAPATGWSEVSHHSFPYSALYGHTLFYSAQKGGVMLFGGNDGQGWGNNFRAGTFILRDGDWSSWGSTSIFGMEGWTRQHHAVTVLPSGEALVFGGRAMQNRADTLRLSFIPGSEQLSVIIQPRGGGVFQSGASTTVWTVLSDAKAWVGSVEDLAVVYQWRRDGQPLVNGQGPGAMVSGADSVALRLVGLRAADEGVYDCVATGCGAGLTTLTQTIEVICRTDLTTTAVPWLPGYGVPDGTLNTEDFFFYLSAFAQGILGVADITSIGATAPGQPGWLIPDGQITNDDFFAYLTQYTAGC